MKFGLRIYSDEEIKDFKQHQKKILKFRQGLEIWLLKKRKLIQNVKDQKKLMINDKEIIEKSKLTKRSIETNNHINVKN